MTWRVKAGCETKDVKSLLELFTEVITAWQRASHSGSMQKRGNGVWLRDLFKKILKFAASCLTADRSPPILGSVLLYCTDRGYCKNPLNYSHSVLITRTCFPPCSSWRGAKGCDKMSLGLKIGSRFTCCVFRPHLLINLLSGKTAAENSSRSFKQLLPLCWWTWITSPHLFT